MQTNISNSSKQFRRWCDFEEQELLKEVSESMPIYAIAKAHDRSKRAIEIRLLDIAIRMIDSGLSYEEVYEKTKCTEERIKHRLIQIDQEKSQNRQKTHEISSQNPAEFPFRQIETTEQLTILQILKDLSHDIKELKAQLSK